jgi:hypothetical protein
MDNTHDTIYSTSDLYIAAWLLLNGLPMQKVDQHSDPRRSTFIFEDRPDRPKLVHDFLHGLAVGNVVDFTYSLRKVKLFALFP